MTNPKQDTWQAVKDCAVTKVHGQPTNQDIDHLEEELIAIASNFHSELGGGSHGHAGLLKSAAEYELLAPGTPFFFPANPGVYPQGNFPAAQRGQQEAEHNALIKQFQTCVGASKGLKDLILKAIDKDYLLELKEEGIAYLNVTPLQMLTHLWGTMEFVDVTALLAEFDAPWNAAEVPQKYFNRIEKARKKLVRANVQVDEQAMMAKALKSFKDAGDFNTAIHEWEVRPAAMQTYANLKILMNTEVTKLNWQDVTTERATWHGSANNVVEDMAQATEELVAELTKRQAKQVKSLMKSHTEKLVEKLTTAILAIKPAVSAGNASTGSGNSKEVKAAAWAEKKRTATVCPHCD